MGAETMTPPLFAHCDVCGLEWRNTGNANVGVMVWMRCPGCVAYALSVAALAKAEAGQESEK